MIKLLRKRAKLLMVVFGSLLMVTFLAPQAVQQFGQQQQGRTQYVIGRGESAREISFEQVQRSLRERRAVEMLVEQVFGTDPARKSRFIGEDNEHWLLLVHAAEEAGLVGDRADGEIWANGFWRTARRRNWEQISQLALQFGPTAVSPAALEFSESFFAMSPEEQEALLDQEMIAQLNRASANSRLPVNDVYVALSKARGIQRLFTLYSGTRKTSTPAVLYEAQQINDEIVVDVVAIPGEAAAFPGEPDPQLLDGFFQERRDLRPIESPDGIGYLVPDRVRYEFIEINRDEIRDAIVRDSGATLRFEVRRDFGEGWEAEYERRLDELTDEKLGTALRAVRAATNAATAKLRRIDGVFIIPDDWDAPTADDLADAVEAIGIPRPAVGRIDRLETGEQMTERAREANDVRIAPPEDMSPEDVEEALLFSRFSRSRPEPRPLSPDAPRPANNGMELAFRVQEIFDSEDYNVQVGIPATDHVLRSVWDPISGRQSGNAYILRVTEASGPSPAESVESVGDTLLDDFRRAQGYQVLQTEIPSISGTLASGGVFGLRDEYASRALEDGLDIEAAQLLRYTARRVVTPPAVPVSGSLALRSEAFRDAIVARASQFDRTRPIAEQPEINPYVIVPVESALSLAVAEIRFIRPMTSETFPEQVFSAIQSIDQSQQEGLPLILEVYGKEALIERYGFEDKTPEDDEDAG